MENDDKLLSPGEVAKRLGVHPKTLIRWSDAGKIPSVRTLGGHRRYRESVVKAIESGTFKL
jgi:excisionase family DNA binding protein